MKNNFSRSSIFNTSSNAPQPKFYKIIESQQELCHLSIPTDFASRYYKNMLNPVYLGVPNGNVWEVAVERIRRQISLARGWKDFIDYYSIIVGHLLVFEYNGRSHFTVSIFDFNATEIKYPTSEIESDDSLGASDTVEHSSENLSHGALVQERKRKRQEREEEDDIPVNLQSNANVIEEEEYQDHKDEETNNGSEEDGPKRNSRFSIVNLIDDDPYYEIIVKKTHSTYMTIPMRFALKTGIDNIKKMRLVNEEGKEWEVEIMHDQRGIIIKRGWAEFRTHNKIVSGEACRFKLIQGHDVGNVLQVQKIPTPHYL